MNLMIKVLFTMILVAFLILIAFRITSPSSEESSHETSSDELSEREDRLSQNTLRPQKTSSRSYERLMEKMAKREMNEGIGEFVRRVDPDEMSFREIYELLNELEDDHVSGLLLMDRIWENPDRNWMPLEREMLRRRSGYFAAKADSENLFLRLSKLEKEDDRAIFVEGVGEGLGEDDVENAVDWARSLDDSLQGFALQGVGRSLGKKDENAARLLAERFEDHTIRENVLIGFVSGLAEKDAEAAREYALSEGEFRDALMIEISASIAFSDPQKASEWVVNASSISRIQKQKIVLEQGISQWAEADFDAAADWAMRVSNSDLRDVAMISLVDNWAKDDPKKASEWAAEFPTEEARAGMLERSLPQWVRANSTEAAAWFDEQTIDIPTILLLRKTLQNLAEKDLLSAHSLLEKIDQPALKQIGLESISQH